MHLNVCRRHKDLHILGDWWPWPSTICGCLSVFEDGGYLLETYAFCLDPIGAQLVTICSTMWVILDKPCYRFTMIRECEWRVQVLAHKENPQRTSRQCA